MVQTVEPEDENRIGNFCFVRTPFMNCIHIFLLWYRQLSLEAIGGHVQVKITDSLRHDSFSFHAKRFTSILVSTACD